MKTPTPHNTAKYGDFAKTVLMPGDPLRARFIAENYLENAAACKQRARYKRLDGLLRRQEGFGHGVGYGMPSIAIYAHELFDCYGVECIIRVGSAGAVADDVNLRDIVLAQAACTNSAFAASYRLPGDFAPIGDFGLLKKAESAALARNVNARTGNVLSSDVFYDDSLEKWKGMGVLAVEMETAALYMKAAQFGKRALAVLTVSDCPLRGESLPAEQRQTSFTQMIEIALETAE